MYRFTLLLVLASLFLMGDSVTVAHTPFAPPVAQASPAHAQTNPAPKVGQPLRPLAFTETGHAAFPSLVLEPNGTLRLAYRQGTDHYLARDGRIMIATSRDLGQTFRAPKVVKSAPGVDFRDPTLAFINGHLWTTWFTGSAVNGAEGAWVQRDDRQPIRIDQLPYAAIAAPVRLLPDGTLGAVYYGHAAGEPRDSAWFARSRDSGRTWTSTRIANGPAADVDFQEPWLVLRQGQLIVTHRYGSWDGIGMVTSADSGQSWTTPRRILDHATGRPNAYVLRSGKIAMSYRDTVTHDAMLTFSLDGGQIWGTPTVLLAAPPDDIGTTYADFAEVKSNILLTVVGMQRTDGSSFLSIGSISPQP